MKLLSHEDLKKKGLSYSAEHLRRMEAVGTFPQRMPGKRLWVESEVDEWLEAWAAQREGWGEHRNANKTPWTVPALKQPTST